MATLALRESKLTDELYKIANREGIKADDILEEAVRNYLDRYEEKRIWAESEAWYALPAEVRNQYRGRYVAVYNGEIVDSDTERRTLYIRVRDRFDRQPVLIVEGGDQPMPTYYVHSVRAAN